MCAQIHWTYHWFALKLWFNAKDFRFQGHNYICGLLAAL